MDRFTWDRRNTVEGRAEETMENIRKLLEYIGELQVEKQGLKLEIARLRASAAGVPPLKEVIDKTPKYLGSEVSGKVKS